MVNGDRGGGVFGGGDGEAREVGEGELRLDENDRFSRVLRG